MSPFWLLRAKRWVQNPPSQRRVILVLTVIALTLGLALIEHFFGWPEALTVERLRRSVF